MSNTVLCHPALFSISSYTQRHRIAADTKIKSRGSQTSHLENVFITPSQS